MAISFNRLTNANIYVEGNSFLGRAEEITLPQIKSKMSAHKALGMIAEVEFPSGFEKLEGKIKWNAIYPDVVTQTGNPYQTLKLQVRASLETYDSSGRNAEVPVVVFVTVQFKNALPALGFKMQDNVEMESEFSATQMRIEVDGEQLLEIDVLAQIYRVNGEDTLANYRSALGI